MGDSLEELGRCVRVEVLLDVVVGVTVRNRLVPEPVDEATQSTNLLHRLILPVVVDVHASSCTR